MNLKLLPKYKWEKTCLKNLLCTQVAVHCRQRHSKLKWLLKTAEIESNRHFQRLKRRFQEKDISTVTEKFLELQNLSRKILTLRHREHFLVKHGIGVHLPETLWGYQAVPTCVKMDLILHRCKLIKSISRKIDLLLILQLRVKFKVNCLKIHLLNKWTKLQIARLQRGESKSYLIMIKTPNLKLQLLIKMYQPLEYMFIPITLLQIQDLLLNSREMELLQDSRIFKKRLKWSSLAVDSLRVKKEYSLLSINTSGPKSKIYTSINNRLVKTLQADKFKALTLTRERDAPSRVLLTLDLKTMFLRFLIVTLWLKRRLFLT